MARSCFTAVPWPVCTWSALMVKSDQCCLSARPASGTMAQMSDSTARQLDDQCRTRVNWGYPLRQACCFSLGSIRWFSFDPVQWLGTYTSTLVQHCLNVIQMFCFYRIVLNPLTAGAAYSRVFLFFSTLSTTF